MTGTGLHRTDGDGWVDCSCGERHWGRYGASGLMLVDPGLGVLLQHRASWSHHGDTWGVPGGARASGESTLEAALREAAEEAAVEPASVRPSHAWVNDHGDWSYTHVVATTDDPDAPHPSDPESQEIRWVPVDEVATLPLLPAFGLIWPAIREQVGRRLVLVVDAANVVGSRPDGWWRDRPGATARLLEQLAGLDIVASGELDLPATWWWPRVVVVVEGQARAVDAVERVEIVRAGHEGDDAIADAVQSERRDRPHDHVVAVTADRELRGRLTRLGARTVGPRTLLALLDG